MAKNEPKSGRSMRNGNSAAPYTKHDKRPYPYRGEFSYADGRARAQTRLANGDLHTKANDSRGNKYP